MMENLSDRCGRWECRRLIDSGTAAVSDLFITYELFEMTEKNGGATFVMTTSVTGGACDSSALVLGNNLWYAKTFFDLAFRGKVTPCTILDVLEDFDLYLSILH